MSQTDILWQLFFLPVYAVGIKLQSKVWDEMNENDINTIKQYKKIVRYELKTCININTVTLYESKWVPPALSQSLCLIDVVTKFSDNYICASATNESQRQEKQASQQPSQTSDQPSCCLWWRSVLKERRRRWLQHPANVHQQRKALLAKIIIDLTS